MNRARIAAPTPPTTGTYKGQRLRLHELDEIVDSPGLCWVPPDEPRDPAEPCVVPLSAQQMREDNRKAIVRIQRAIVAVASVGLVLVAWFLGVV